VRFRVGAEVGTGFGGKCAIGGPLQRDLPARSGYGLTTAASIATARHIWERSSQQRRAR